MALAFAHASSYMTAARLQPQQWQWPHPAMPDLRVSTITPASIATLQQAGAWQHIQPHAASFETMQVSLIFLVLSVHVNVGRSAVCWLYLQTAVQHLGTMKQMEHQRGGTVFLWCNKARTVAHPCRWLVALCVCFWWLTTIGTHMSFVIPNHRITTTPSNVISMYSDPNLACRSGTLC